SKRHSVRTDNKPAIALGSERRQGSLNFVCVMHADTDQLDLECRGPGFSKFEEVNTGGRLGGHHVPDSIDFGPALPEKLQPFSSHRAFPIGEPREVGIGTRLVVDKTGTDRIGDSYENNWDDADFRLNNGRH